MKTIFTGALACAALTLVVMPAQAQTVLKFNNFLPPQHGQVVDVFEPWAKNVEEASEGRVKVEFLPSTVAAPPRMFDVVESGAVDVAWGVPAYTPGRFTLTKALDLPFLGDNAEALSLAYWTVHEEMFNAADEFSGVKVLAVYTTGPGTIYTTGEPPQSLDGFAGKKYRAGGKAPQEIAEAFGGAGVTSPSSEAYEMLSRKVVDGAFWTHEAYESYKLGDVVDGQFSVPAGLYNSAVYIIMNQEKWDSLSQEDKDAVWSVSGEALARLGGQAWDAADVSAIKLMEADGVKRFTADGVFLDEIHERLRPLEESWIAEAEAKGVDGRAALDRIRELSGAK
ncbi:TRAP transporter substrate-binding protein [Martelella soudanensis]|uniref:TRAP transporter substrate-binding protein n=1 Tax=unclassified Martelella TaxID=2629616 RepID=UPI0015E034AC|nr:MULTISPECIES: TRAP transporter substrate-binding protein [unclassified Martelella]